MLISIGANIFDSPWGGGNKFAIILAEYLKSKGWEVINNLNKPDIDLILLTELLKYFTPLKFNQINVSKSI